MNTELPQLSERACYAGKHPDILSCAAVEITRAHAVPTITRDGAPVPLGSEWLPMMYVKAIGATGAVAAAAFILN